MAILETKALTKSYRTGNQDLRVLDQVSISVPEAAVAAIVGASGSGKTTLLGLCAGLDHATEGEVYLNSDNITHYSEDQRAYLRRTTIGFIFQSFQLIPTLNAIENVMIPAELNGGSAKKAKAKAAELLERVGLGQRLKHYPAQLSGGEQQRVAIARAFIHEPKILFADEPTGNLDETSSQIIEEMLFSLNAEFGTTLIIVTHDLDLAAKSSVQFRLKGGKQIDPTLR
jgi:putative ABC transport system ATP-binding protein